MKNVQTIIEQSCGLAPLLKQKRLVIRNASHHLEISACIRSAFGDVIELDVAHPRDRDAKGSLCDPWMNFRVTLAKPAWVWLPLAYHNDYRNIHQCAAEFVGHACIIHVINGALVHELRLVADMWDSIIGRLGYVQAPWTLEQR